MTLAINSLHALAFGLHSQIKHTQTEGEKETETDTEAEAVTETKSLLK